MHVVASHRRGEVRGRIHVFSSRAGDIYGMHSLGSQIVGNRHCGSVSSGSSGSIVDRETDVLTGSNAGRQGGQIGQGQHGIGGNRDAVDTKCARANVADGEILAGSRANGKGAEIVGFRSNREYGAGHHLLHHHVVYHQVIVAIATDGGFAVESEILHAGEAGEGDAIVLARGGNGVEYIV